MCRLSFLVGIFFDLTLLTESLEPTGRPPCLPLAADFLDLTGLIIDPLIFALSEIIRELSIGLLQ
jgi:hypothetical protein